MPRAKKPETTKLGKKIQRTKKVVRKMMKPAWDGPHEGLTQSILSKYLVCRERFRVRMIEGLTSPDRFSHRLEFGQMWHECEEAHAEGLGREEGEEKLKKYAQALAIKYREQSTEVNKWYQICKRVFPVYLDYWKKHPDVKKRTPLLQEESFSIPYALPSGRTVLLRGKWDSVDIVTENRKKGIWLQENKTKGEVQELRIERQLAFDLQTMFYLVALAEYRKGSQGALLGSIRLRGVRYNVIRRPLSGGKGSITQLKDTNRGKRGSGKNRKNLPVRPEPDDEFYGRLAGIIRDEPEHFFMRWKVEVFPEDLEKFKHRFLNPVLENLCDDYEWWSHCKFEGVDPFDYVARGGRRSHLNGGRHWVLPFGVYNPVAEDRPTDLDEYLLNGSRTGLVYNDNFFPELED